MLNYARNRLPEIVSRQLNILKAFSGKHQSLSTTFTTSHSTIIIKVFKMFSNVVPIFSPAPEMIHSDT